MTLAQQEAAIWAAQEEETPVTPEEEFGRAAQMVEGAAKGYARLVEVQAKRDSLLLTLADVEREIERLVNRLHKAKLDLIATLKEEANA